MTKRTVTVLSNDQVTTVPATRADFSDLVIGSPLGTTGFVIASAGRFLHGQDAVSGSSESALGNRVVSYVRGSLPAETSLGRGVISSSARAESVVVTVRPQVVQKEMVTERLNRSLSLGYTPPVRSTAT